jgi:mono/diheme cytochrome c family protein
MRRALSLAGIIVASVVLAGCNLADSGTNLVNGKEKFVEQCARCHVLARAGATGVTGPNLDEAFQRARQDGFGESTFEGLVHAQILHPAINPQYDPVTRRQAASMPANLVTGEDAEDVAAYVASAAGKPGDDTGALAEVGGGPEGTAEAENGVLEIPAAESGALYYVFADATAPAGPLKIESRNDSPVEHDIAIEGNGVDEKGEVVSNGGVSEIDTNLQAGEYTFYCSVEGHRAGGMEGTLTVE